MFTECRECARLWQEYAQANSAFLKIASNLQVARIQQDSVAVAALAEQYESAGDKRQAARKAAKDHGATHARSRAASQG